VNLPFPSVNETVPARAALPAGGGPVSSSEVRDPFQVNAVNLPFPSVNEAVPARAALPAEERTVSRAK
jgi:hypothetical protein